MEQTKLSINLQHLINQANCKVRPQTTSDITYIVMFHKKRVLTDVTDRDLSSMQNANLYCPPMLTLNKELMK